MDDMSGAESNADDEPVTILKKVLAWQLRKRITMTQIQRILVIKLRRRKGGSVRKRLSIA